MSATRPSRWPHRGLVRAWPGMSGDRSRCCETAGEAAQIGQVDPGGFAGDCCLKVFCEAAAAAQLGEPALHYPAPRQEYLTERALDGYAATCRNPGFQGVPRGRG